jgi:hypothetical protein
MSTLFKKTKSEHIFVLVICLFVVVYFIYKFYKHLESKGKSGSEYYGSSMGPQYGNNQPSNKQGGMSSGMNNQPSSGNMNMNMNTNVLPSTADTLQNGTSNDLMPAPVMPGTQTSMPGLPTSCSKPNIQNPAELLPKDANSQWASLNPNGKGFLSNINLLNAGFNIGIDTIGSSLRNANLQIRSEPVNPQLNVGPWNQSTITPDFMRPPLEIGCGSQ